MTDLELVAKIKKGDMDAFDKLVDSYSNRVANTAYSLLSDREDALDAAQEVFIKVHRYIDNFRGDCSVSTWIFRITKTVCTDMLRKRKANIISLDDEDDDEPKFEIADETTAPEHIAERNAKVDAVRSAISQLDENMRLVISLCDIQGLSYDEAAAVMKCPVGTVKSRLYRARDHLRKILSENRELFI